LEKAGMESERLKFAMIIKQRAQAGVIDSMNIVGAEVVKGNACIIVDDIADTCGTLCKAAQALKDAGASMVFAAVAHPVFSKDARKVVEESVLEELVCTDTIDHEKESLPSKVKVISVATLLAESIIRIHSGTSLSELFLYE